jgi:putative transposase
MVCHRYIELNPVRAGMVTHPSEYAWSSYRRNAHGEADALVTPHYLYGRLGADDVSRERAYRELFSAALDASTLCEIRRATNGNFSLGNREFTDQMSSTVGRPVVPKRAGRPRTQ